MGKRMWRAGVVLLTLLLVGSILLPGTLGWQELGQNAQNEFSNAAAQTGKIRVKKVLAGSYPAKDKNQDFSFHLIVDGKQTDFHLRDGQTQEFTLVAGARFEVKEDDWGDYQKSIRNASGTIAAGQVIEVTATNTFVLTETEEERIPITGEKTWDLRGQNRNVLPESITVQLYAGSRLVEESVVKPDSNGRWRYRFTVPKYDGNGKEITYRVQEVPVPNFLPSYNGYHIRNTYVPSVEIDPPVVRKVIQGTHAPETEFTFLLRGEAHAPMPVGANGDSKVMSRTGNGEVEFGTIAFHQPGTYTYTITELNSGVSGWTYDSASYRLTITVTEQQGRLTAQRNLEKAGEPATEAVFTNHYAPEGQPDKFLLFGKKVWNHGANPVTNRPKAIIVQVYGDGQLAVQRQVTEQENWEYLFELPRYAQDGQEIVYTVDEVQVYPYRKEVNGYDLINTYQPDLPPPQTGDSSMVWLFATLMGVSGGILAVLIFWYVRRKRKK